jgi:hypothetical protein
VIKTLRTPTVFCLLTIVITGWLLAWRTPNPNMLLSMGPTWPNSTDIRPGFWLALLITGNQPRITRSRWTFGTEPATDRTAAVIKTAAGAEYHRLRYGEDTGWQKTHNGLPILAACAVEYKPHILRLGLLARVADRTSWHLKTEYLAGFERIDDVVVEAAYAERMKSRTSNHPFPTRWDFFPRAALHDSLFLLTLIAWLISLTSIPRWLIWKHITPTQRRHAKHQCPHCAYELAGLTSPTCPECGNTTEQPAVS